MQRWTEDSGNAALMGRELPPAEVLAADQRITAWARQLKAAGLESDMDELRARAYLDLLLGKDSRPGRAGTPPQAGTAPNRMIRTARQTAEGRGQQARTIRRRVRRARGRAGSPGGSP